MAARYLTSTWRGCTSRSSCSGSSASGAERLRQEEAEWAEVIALIRAEMERGTDPEDAHMQVLAQRWLRLMDETGLGDPAMKQAVKRLWEEQGDNIVAQYGPALDSRPIWGYLDKALAAGTGSTGTQTRAVADVRGTRPNANSLLT
jgi:hypothetical protein